MMKPIEIKKGIHWVGAVDWNVRDFHGYFIPKGTTYNSFLVPDQKVALFDAVKAPFRNALLHNIRKIIEPRKIDYIVVNHVEMDHSGALPELIDQVQPEKIICSAMGKKALLQHFHREDWPYEVVETGQEISLGSKTIQFLETRMLHWPDSMMSYIKEDKLLISSDGFGQHWATSERFDDEVDLDQLFVHAAKYYANILLPFSPLVGKLIESVQKLGLEIDMIAPDHGLIWRQNPSKIVEAYGRWSRQETRKKALIIYNTMWRSTEKMAMAIADGLGQEGVEFKILNLNLNHRSDVMTEVLDAKALILGSSTLNNGIMPPMADMLCYMKGLKPLHKIGTAFGSYGWSGEAVKILTGALEEMKVDVADPGLRVQFAPTHEDLQKCIELGQKMGRLVKGNGG
nr:flavodoxin domain-containing protein [Desulforhabdus sp. TSK]